MRHEALTSASAAAVANRAPHLPPPMAWRWAIQEAVADAAWPALDEAGTGAQFSIEMVMCRSTARCAGKIQVSADASKDAVEKMALEDANVLRFTEGGSIRKIIVVPGRLVNIVAN